jgi:hypothetical protein
VAIATTVSTVGLLLLVRDVLVPLALLLAALAVGALPLSLPLSMPLPLVSVDLGDTKRLQGWLPGLSLKLLTLVLSCAQALHSLRNREAPAIVVVDPVAMLSRQPLVHLHAVRQE